MKKTVIIMASAIIFLVVIALLLSSLLETRTCYAMGRFKWVPSTNFWDGAYSDIAITEKLGKQFRAMYDFLNSRESRLSLERLDASVRDAPVVPALDAFEPDAFPDRADGHNSAE